MGDSKKLDPSLLTEKINSIKESMDDIKRREFEQTQELLVSLTNELFDKVEKMSTSKEIPKIKEKSTQKEIPKIEFTDISWYRKKLYPKKGYDKAKDAHLTHGDNLAACCDVTPSALTLLTPLDGAVIDRSKNPTILFSGSAVADRNSIDHYSIQIFDGENLVFSNTIDKNQDEMSCTLSISELDSNTDYFWNARAADGAGNEGPFAAGSFRFTIVP